MASNPITAESVIPISSILDALEGVLSEAERQALLSQLIDVRTDGVAPGDLITAEMFNGILGDINDLKIRMAGLEGDVAGQPERPVITRIRPDPVIAGQEMVVDGRNLAPALLTRIAVGDSRLTSRNLNPGSGSTRLIFDAPAVIGLPAGGAEVVLEVANAAGSAEASFIMEPGVSDRLAANVDFRLISVEPSGNLARSTNYILILELDITSSHSESFTVVPQLSVDTSTGWSLDIVGSDQISVPVTGANAVTRTVELNLRTGNNNGAGNFTLRLDANRFADFSRSSLLNPVVIGEPILEGDSNVTFSAPRVLGNQSEVTIRDGNILVSRNAASSGTPPVLFRLPLEIDEIGTFDVAVGIDAGDADWTATLNSQSSYVVSRIGEQLPEIAITVVPGSDNASDTLMEVSVTGRGDASNATTGVGLRTVDSV